MQKAGDFLGRVVRRMDRPEGALAWLTGAWPTIVGRTLAAHVRPVRCQGGSLEVAADGKAWRKQLESMQREFCERVNEAWGANLVGEIKFVTAKPGPKSVSHEMDNEHTPFVRRRKA
jgi:predicted nucleic acid-binding Zn ribbon protein